MIDLNTILNVAELGDLFSNSSSNNPVTGDILTESMEKTQYQEKGSLASIDEEASPDTFILLLTQVFANAGSNDLKSIPLTEENDLEPVNSESREVSQEKAESNQLARLKITSLFPGSTHPIVRRKMN